MLDLLLDFVFPRRSLLGHRGTFITREEFARLTPFPVRLESSILKTMGLKHLDRVVAAGSYAGAPLLRRAIYTWKYGRIPGVGEELGRLLVSVIHLLGNFSGVPLDTSHVSSRVFSHSENVSRDTRDTRGDTMKDDTEKCVLCPVPLHWSREFYRGFNQAEQLAMSLSGATNIPVHALLRRSQPTGFQARRYGKERRQFMHAMFRCVATPVPSRVILIDDILTTGATMDECAKVLKEEGATWVGGVVLAKG